VMVMALWLAFQLFVRPHDLFSLTLIVN